PSGASQQGHITNQNGYTAKEVAQLQAKIALSTALAVELLSPSCTWVKWVEIPTEGLWHSKG
ncbi:hypothetical protein IWW34DRAFT_641397, partial [Fusarium oxysporum f. sp. albedinis]